MIRNGILIALALVSVALLVLCIASHFTRLTVPVLSLIPPPPGWRVAAEFDLDWMGVYVEHADVVEHVDDPYPCDAAMVGRALLGRPPRQSWTQRDCLFDAFAFRVYYRKYGLIQCVAPPDGGDPAFSESVPMQVYHVTTKASFAAAFLGAYPAFAFIRRARRRRYVQRRWFAVVAGLLGFAGALTATIGFGFFAARVDRSYGSDIARMLVDHAIVLFVPSVCAIATYVVIAGPLRRRSLREAKLCLNCLYNLTGNESGVCPECGTEIES